VILRSVATATPQPWRNGGGVTRVLLRLPAGSADDWTLRISVADIETDGPFSPFPGVTRWFAAVSGAGVRLSFPKGRPPLRDVRPGDAPLRFDGADAPGCALLEGATRDLNVMVRHHRADALVTSADFIHAAEPGDGLGFGFGFFALQPLTLRAEDARPLPLSALTLAWADSPRDTSRTWSIAPAHGAQEHTLPGYWIRLLPPTR
jgi:hypothetical protein